AVKSVDENLVTRISQVDGLGRTTIVCEISSNSSMPGSGSPVYGCGGTDIAGNGFVTTYSYTLAPPQTRIAQGEQTRTFQSDWLGRPTSVTEPERGTTTYIYTYYSTPVAGLQVKRTRPQANQLSPSVPTNTITQYDTLGRVVSISYDDGLTPTKTFAYDQAAGANFTDHTQANLKGRLSMASVPTAATAYSYDPVGRIAYLDQCLPSGPCGTTGYNRQAVYTYDLGGNLITSTDGAGVTTTYAVTPAGELSLMTSSAPPGVTVPASIVSVPATKYSPFGPTAINFGNQLTNTYTYDPLGRISSGTLAPTSGGNALYTFTSGWKGAQLQNSYDKVLGQTSTYAYDGFNRLSTLALNDKLQTEISNDSSSLPVCCRSAAPHNYEVLFFDLHGKVANTRDGLGGAGALGL
ncbi:MAG: hypothetical protein ACLPM3_06225, partial [Terracidiphilus sp.]